MKINLSNLKFYIVFFLLIPGCTNNPFFEDKIEINENLEVNGKVFLGSNINPENIFIWLEGFNISDWTNDNGDFKIMLPPSASQAGGGLNGIYRLYVYSANYKYEEFDLVVLNGQFKYNTEYLDNDGNFKRTIFLTKILDITTIVEPNKIFSTNKDPINFNVQLESLVDSVIVRTHFNRYWTPSSLIFLEEGAPKEDAILIQGNPAILGSTVIKGVVSWQTSFVFSSNFFSEGIYEVSPYIQIIQQGLPMDLLFAIDENIFDTDYHYLSWPIKQKVGLLRVENISP